MLAAGRISRTALKMRWQGFRNYFTAELIEDYNGTGREQMQLDELVKRFQSFLEA